MTIDRDGRLRERCPDCGQSTPHAVRITLVTESNASEPPGFSREPYRIAACQECGRTRRQRMNHA